MFKFISHIHIFHAFGSKNQTAKKGDIHPVREWLSGLALFIAILIGGGLYNMYQFLEYKNIDTGNGTFVDKMPEYNQTSVEHALEIFKKRTETYELLQKEGAIDQGSQVTKIATTTTTPQVEQLVVPTIVTDIPTTSINIME